MVVAAGPLVVGNAFTAGAGERSVENNVTDIIVYSDVHVAAFILLFYFKNNNLI